jgi:hypothetical protein
VVATANVPLVGKVTAVAPVKVALNVWTPVKVIVPWPITGVVKVGLVAPTKDPVPV